MSKTLKVIQKISKVGQVLSQIVFVFCIIGAVACLFSVVVLSMMSKDSALWQEVINAVIEETGVLLDMNSVVAVLIAAFVVVAGEAVVAKFSALYFKHELLAGTPFTLDGAKEMLRLGIISLAVPIGTSIVSGVIYGVVAAVTSTAQSYNFSVELPIGIGVMFIVVSFILKYGAEISEEKNYIEML